LVDTDGDRIPEVVDGWDQPFRYVSTKPIHNPGTFDLWFAGSDGVDGTEDDVANWTIP
jgi:hypothetical protein